MSDQKFAILKCTEPYIEIVDIPDSCAIVPFFSKIVKFGDCDVFDRIPFYSAGFQMWVNDAGLILPGAPYNIVASILYGDTINCDCVLTGLDTDDGEVSELLPSSLEFIKELQKDCNNKNDCLQFMSSKMRKFLNDHKIFTYR